MKYTVSGVDAKTGEAIEPFMVDAEDERHAVRLVREQGVSPTEIKPYPYPPHEPLDSSDPPESMTVRESDVAFAVTGGWVVAVLMWLGGLFAMAAAKDDLVVLLIGLGFFLGGFIVMLTMAVVRLRLMIEDSARR